MKYRARCLVTAVGLLVLNMPAGALAGADAAQTATRLAQASFSRMSAGPVAAPWRQVGLPGQKLPMTRFDIESRGDGGSVLRMQADGSYGNLVLDTDSAAIATQTRLRWRWQLERGLPASDLLRKQGDDTPLKVCAMFDMALDGLSFGEQAKLRMARALSGEPLPTATLCYVWDRLLPLGSIVPNVFSARVRYVVASSGPPRPGQWVIVERALGEDFLRAFGDETRVLPALLALAVGADADNTGGSSLGYLGDIVLLP